MPSPIAMSQAGALTRDAAFLSDSDDDDDVEEEEEEEEELL
jgi:hypothetical protein